MHIDTILLNAPKSLGFIIRAGKVFSEAKTLIILYCTYVMSYLEYVSQI